MKRAFYAFALFALMTLFVSPAAAVDTAATASVELVTGVTCVESQTMDFGQVAIYNGTIKMEALGTLDDTGSTISFDATGSQEAQFDVTSPVGATIDIAVAYDAAADGLVLSAASVAWNGAGEVAAPGSFTSTGADVLHVGATLTVDADNAVVGAFNPGYTVSVTLN